MDFISWTVFAILCMLAEFTSGSFYLLAIGIAMFYPAVADVLGAPMNVQVGLLVGGSIVHILIVIMLRKRKGAGPSTVAPVGMGERVDVIEWLDECSARVTYRGEEWGADKVDAEMPDADHGTIESVRGSRLIISTREEPAENT